MKKIMLNSKKIKQVLKKQKYSITKTGLLGLVIITVGSFFSCEKNNEEKEILPIPTEMIEINEDIVVDEIEMINVEKIVESLVTPIPDISVDEVVIENPIVTEKPVMIEEVSITKEIVETKTPKVTQAPVITEAPVVTEIPKKAEEPAVTEAPKVPTTSTEINDSVVQDKKTIVVTYDDIINKAKKLESGIEELGYSYKIEETAISLIYMANRDYISDSVKEQLIGIGEISVSRDFLRLSDVFYSEHSTSSFVNILNGTGKYFDLSTIFFNKEDEKFVKGYIDGLNDLVDFSGEKEIKIYNKINNLYTKEKNKEYVNFKQATAKYGDGAIDVVNYVSNTFLMLETQLMDSVIDYSFIRELEKRYSNIVSDWNSKIVVTNDKNKVKSLIINV